MMTLRDAIIHYLDTAVLMQLATVSGEQPWCSTVFFAADNGHNIYWLSLPNSRHSKELSLNDRVAATITWPHQYGQAWQGLQIEGTVKEVDTDEMEEFFQAYAERYNAHSRLSLIMSGEDPARLYRLKPSLIVLYDEQNYPTEPRQEWRPN